MQEINRDKYLNKLISKRENGAIKIITGIRRCGKSYLLFELFKKFLINNGMDENHIIALSLDDEENIEYRDAENLFEYIKSRIVSNDEKYCVLLDEAQLAISEDEFKGKNDIIRLYSILNSLLKKRNVDVYITGSNSKFLSSDVLTEFRGRGDEIRLLPLSFAEFMSVYEGNTQEGYKQYSLYGGLPFTLSKETDYEKIKYLKDMFNLTYLKDIIERYNLRNDESLSILLDILASDIGSLTNPNKLVKTFNSKGIKSNDITLSSYLGYLEDAFIVSKAKRYDIKGKKYISTPFKYYFTDIGLRNARLNFRQIEPTHIMENIIYNELIYRDFTVDVGAMDTYTKNNNGDRKLAHNEVDFVANQGYKKYYIQSAYLIPTEEKMQQECNSLNKIDDSFKKIIVTSDPLMPINHNERGYSIMNIFDFLLNPNSLEL